MPGYILGNRPADGGVTLMVDGYGSFGSSVCSAPGNSFFYLGRMRIIYAWIYSW